MTDAFGSGEKDERARLTSLRAERRLSLLGDDDDIADVPRQADDCERGVVLSAHSPSLARSRFRGLVLNLSRTTQLQLSLEKAVELRKKRRERGKVTSQSKTHTQKQGKEGRER